MDNKELVKEAVKSAESELREEEKIKIKNIVKTMLEVLQRKKETRKNLDDEIRIIEKDLSDFKEGRVDRIKERQDIDPKAKDVSIIIVKEKIVEKYIPTPMWYVPWIIAINPQYVPTYFTCGTGTITTNNTWTSDQLLTDNTCDSFVSFTTNNSATHMHTGGTYQLADGTVKYI